jgi:hypothetical protein
MARKEDEVEAIFDFVDAILDGNAGHKWCSNSASKGCRAAGRLGIGSLTGRRYRHQPASARGNSASALRSAFCFFDAEKACALVGGNLVAPFEVAKCYFPRGGRSFGQGALATYGSCSVRVQNVSSEL